MVDVTSLRSAGHRKAADGLRPLIDAVTLPAVLVLALMLRLAAAQSSLGLDEIWSLHNAGTLGSVGDAFWGLPHDNNHSLNTAFMVLLGPERPAWLYRLPSVLVGTFTVFAVAVILRPKGPATVRLGALLAAVCLPWVDFGSEARGYAGLTLASVLAIGFWERAVAMQPGPVRQGGADPARWGLAASAVIGALSHFAMLLTLFVLGTATLIVLGMRSRRVVPALAGTLWLFIPTGLGLLPVGLAVAVATWRHGGFAVGNVVPFTPGTLVIGMSDMVSFTVGLPAAPTSPLLGAVVLACLAWAWGRGLLGPAFGVLCVAAFPVLLATLWIARVPNTGYARYFAICAVVLVLASAEIGGRLWLAGTRVRRATLAAVACAVAGSLVGDGNAIRTGRSSARETLAIMQAEGGAAYMTDRPLMARLLLGAAHQDSPPQVAVDTSCGSTADWFIAVGLFDSRIDGTATVGGPACPHVYRRRATFESNPLSGTQWTLYRRAP